MAMEGATIMIKLKDGVHLDVSKAILIEDSPKFRELIDEQHQSELEFDDFSPESVTLFLVFLEDRRLGEIDNVQFREMNKLANVFEVSWMRKGCKKWMEGRIESVNTDDEKVFIFEECLYILKKWPEKTLMESFIARLVKRDNSSFVSQYLTQIDTLDTLKLDHILMVGGCNPEPFLRSITANLEGKRDLSQNIKHLLNNMNLVLCFELDEKLYLEVFDKIRNLSGISTEDVKFVLQLSTETMKSVRSRREERKERKIELFNGAKDHEIFNSTNALSDIKAALLDGKVTSMFMVVELLLSIYYKNKPITEDSQSIIITTLEDICGERKCNKVLKQHLEMIINALNYSPLPQKVKIISLLNKIKNNDKLSTCHEYILKIFAYELSDTSPTGKKILRKVTHLLKRDDNPAERTYKSLYSFRHPYVRECQEPGKCGFVTLEREHEQAHGYYIGELCTDSKYYKGTGLHLHDIVSTRDMCWYYTYSGSTAPDNKIDVVGIWWNWWWLQWLPNVTDWKFEHECIDYNVSHYTVFKRK